MLSSFLKPDDLNFYIRQYLATSHEPARAEVLGKVSQMLLHPSQILDCPLLAENHPLKKEALTISDAFEAVTNGMENPEALTQLEGISPEGLFGPWKALILGLRALYEEETTLCLEYMESLPSTSPLFKLAPLMKALCGSEASLTLRDKEMALLVVDKNTYTASVLTQVHDALVTGMMDLFLTLVPSALEALGKVDQDAARSLSLWTLSQLEKYDLDYQELFNLIQGYWGIGEGSRLISLGLYALDPEASLLFWMIFLKNLPTDSRYLSAGFEIFQDMAAGVRDFQAGQGTGEGFPEDFGILVSGVLRIHPSFGEVFSHRGWEDFQRPTLRAGILSKTRVPEKVPVQFELFAS